MSAGVATCMTAWSWFDVKLLVMCAMTCSAEGVPVPLVPSAQTKVREPSNWSCKLYTEIGEPNPYCKDVRRWTRIIWKYSSHYLALKGMSVRQRGRLCNRYKDVYSWNWEGARRTSVSDRQQQAAHDVQLWHGQSGERSAGVILLTSGCLERTIQFFQHSIVNCRRNRLPGNAMIAVTEGMRRVRREVIYLEDAVSGNTQQLV